MTCQHKAFKAVVGVTRLVEAEGAAAKGFTADITVTCAECHLPFRFMGLPAGSHPQKPMVSADALELRAPIEPAYVQEILGQPVISGRA